MTDKEVYAEINGKRVCISRASARVTKPSQQDKLKYILPKLQMATVFDMGIDAAYIAVLELERKEKGIPSQETTRVGPVVVNIGEKSAAAGSAS